MGYDVLLDEGLMDGVYVGRNGVWWGGVRVGSYVNHMDRNLFFGIIEQAFNGKGILLNGLLRSIYKQRILDYCTDLYFN